MVNDNGMYLNSGEIKKMIFEIRENEFRELLVYAISLTIKEAGIRDSFMMKLNFSAKRGNYSNNKYEAYCRHLRIDSGSQVVGRIWNDHRSAKRDNNSNNKSRDSQMPKDLIERRSFEKIWSMFNGRSAAIEEVLKEFDLQSLLKTFVYMEFQIANDYFPYAGAKRNFLDVYMDRFSIDLHKRLSLEKLFFDLIEFRNTFAHRYDAIKFIDASKGLNAMKDLAKELTVNSTMRSLGEKVIDQSEKLLYMLNHPYTCQELQSLYRDRMRGEASEEQVRDAVLCIKTNDMIEANMYIFDIDELMNQLHLIIKGDEKISSEEKRSHYLQQLRRYKGGIMDIDDQKSMADCFTPVLSRDFVESDQFEYLLFKPGLWDFSMIIPYTVLCELGALAGDKTHPRRESFKRIYSKLEKLRDENKLVCRKMCSSAYSEDDLLDYFEAHQDNGYCVLTLQPDKFSHRELKNVLCGKYLVSGDFMLYQRSVALLRASRKAEGSKTFWTEEGSMVRAEQKINCGGEGSIWSTDRDNKVIKLFELKADDLEEKKKKLSKMIAKNPNIPQICWPEHLVYRDKEQKEFVGYMMPHCDKEAISCVYHLNDDDGAVTDAQRSWDRKKLADICRQIAEIADKLHRFGREESKNRSRSYQVLMGDISDKNILIDRYTGEVSFVDCDSYSFYEYKCKVMNDTFRTPKMSDVYRERYRFALLFFKILMRGADPIRRERGESYEDALKNGSFAFPCTVDSTRHELHASIAEGSVSYVIWINMPDKIRDLFAKAFVKRIPPEMAEWEKKLADYRDKIEMRRYSNESLPTRYLNEERTDFGEIECDFCRFEHPDDPDACKTNMPAKLRNRLQKEDRLLFCPSHAYMERELCRIRKNTEKATCDKCGKEFTSTSGELILLYFRKGNKTYCPRCQGRMKGVS